ncbi:MAG: transposase, partial [Oceanicoccus sp.]|uniref:IS91 family transposase n=1 Tax=Oceanicoccus sp. TaxID=2691044 RepID=UPI0026369DDB
MASVVCRHDAGAYKQGLGLAKILDRYLAGYVVNHRLSYYQERVVSAIRACRTSTLGGHVYRCNDCGYRRYDYDSCRNRHCPRCQVYQKVKWVATRLSELLPIPYFHGVFTMPDSLNQLALYNKELIYDMFFKATSQALNAFAQDPRFLGAKLGFIGILHTWGQALNQHIHLHYIITGGGLSNDGTRWVNLPYRKKFLFPARAVSKRVRRDFAKLLWKAYRQDKLVFPDELAYLAEPSCFDRFLKKVAWQNWLCYMKEPFGSPEVVVKYIGRYTHRVAISDSRINSTSDGRINFDYKKYQSSKVYP